MKVLGSLAIAASILAAAATMAHAADATMTATFDGKPWTASFSQAVLTSMAGKPVLNLSGTQQGSPTMTFNSMLVLGAPDALFGTYNFKSGFPANGGNFNVLDGGALTENVRFTTGKVVIDSYDATAGTVSGHFEAVGKDDAGRSGIEVKDGAFADVPVTRQ